MTLFSNGFWLLFGLGCMAFVLACFGAVLMFLGIGQAIIDRWLDPRSESEDVYDEAWGG